MVSENERKATQLHHQFNAARQNGMTVKYIKDYPNSELRYHYIKIMSFK